QTITSLSPSSVPAGLTSATFTVSGAGFNTTSTALFDGVDARPTAVLSAAQLTFTLGASELAVSGVHTVQVRTLACALDTCFVNLSNPASLTIGGGGGGGGGGAVAPTLLIVAPGTFPKGAAGIRVSLLGTNFRPGAQVTVSSTTPFTGGAP